MDFIFKSIGRSDSKSRHSVSAPDECKAFGIAAERSQRDSEDLLTHVGTVSDHITALVSSHNQALAELSGLHAERARLDSLLADETAARRRLDETATRLEAENARHRDTIVHLTTVGEKTETEFTALQSSYATLHQNHIALSERLEGAERELAERTEFLEQATHTLSEAQKEVKARGSELAILSADLDAEKTARALETEIAAKENAGLSREVARLSGDRTQLSKERDRWQAEAEAALTQVSALKQELAKSEQRQRQAREELETLRANSEMEISHLSARVESILSKSDLVEKLLATARDRNATTDAELQNTRGEFRAAKTELSGALARAERLTQDLSRARTSASESEAARRTQAIRLEEAAARLRDSESTCETLQREIFSLRRDHGVQTEADHAEIQHLRTSLEIARSEIEQIRAENALLSGHVETARADRTRASERRGTNPGTLSVISVAGDTEQTEASRDRQPPHAAE